VVFLETQEGAVEDCRNSLELKTLPRLNCCRAIEWYRGQTRHEEQTRNKNQTRDENKPA